MSTPGSVAHYDSSAVTDSDITTQSNIFSGPCFGDITPSQASVTEDQSSNSISPRKPLDTRSEFISTEYAVLRHSDASDLDRIANNEQVQEAPPTPRIDSNRDACLASIQSPICPGPKDVLSSIIDQRPQSADHTNEESTPDSSSMADDKAFSGLVGYALEQGEPQSRANSQSHGETQHIDGHQETASRYDSISVQHHSPFAVDVDLNGLQVTASGYSNDDSQTSCISEMIYELGHESYDLPRSSPPLDVVSSPPPTSSPQVFTSSPRASSQTSSVSSIPELKLSPEGAPDSKPQEQQTSSFTAAFTILPEDVFVSPPPSAMSPIRKPDDTQDIHPPQDLSDDTQLPGSDSINSSFAPEVPRLDPSSQERAYVSTMHLQAFDYLPVRQDSEGKDSVQQGVHCLNDATSNLQSVNVTINPALEGKAQCTPEMMRTPTPKRPTFASQNKALKKLATPFRSPLMQGPKLEDTETDISTGASSAKLTLSSRSTSPLVDPFAELQEIKEKNKGRENANPNPIVVDKKHRTVRAGAQFKSPLSVTAAASAGKSSIRLTPSIQMLERKVQLLRRAVKVKKEREEVTLKDLIKTWTEAGREVSYQLFELAREREGSGGSWGGGGVRKFEESWGWNTQEGAKRAKIEDQDGSWGWSTMSSESSIKGSGEVEVMDVDEQPPARDDCDDDEDKPEATVGTMLRQLGVDSTILGWDDNEGTFVDRC